MKPLRFLPEFRPLIESGRKTKTFRRTMHGEAGDVFEPWPGVKVRLVHDPAKTKAWAVAEFHHRDEGFDSPAEFMRCLKRIHPRQRDLDQMVGYLHSFELVKP